MYICLFLSVGPIGTHLNKASLENEREFVTKRAGLTKQIDAAFEEDDFDKAEELQEQLRLLEVGRDGDEEVQEIANLNSNVLAPVQMAPIKELDELPYPNIPLNEYEKTDDFWFINKAFPKLRAIHKDPWIFICPDVVTRFFLSQGGSRQVH